MRWWSFSMFMLGYILLSISTIGNHERAAALEKQLDMCTLSLAAANQALGVKP